MKNIFSRCFFLTLICVSFLTAADQVLAIDKIKIGVSTPLTGDSATFGTDIKDFVTFANEVLGEGKYELIFEDDKCTSKDGVSVANKLIHIDRVHYVLGFGCSGTTLAAAPLYEKAKILSIVTFASSPKIRDAGDFMFRTFPSDSVAGITLGQYVAKHNKSVAVISAQSDYSQDLKDVFAKSLPNTIQRSYEDFLPGTVDFRSTLLKIKSKSPEALFVNSQTEGEFTTIITQLQDLKWTPKLYGAYWPSSPAVLKNVAPQIEGITFVDTPSLDDLLNEEGKKLLGQYLI